MSSSDDRKLEEMLRSRPVESPSSDLAERIVLRAQSLPQKQRTSPGRRLRELFAEFYLPRPAYVLAGALVVGLVAGFNMPTPIARETPNALYAQTFLDVDEELL